MQQIRSRPALCIALCLLSLTSGAQTLFESNQNSGTVGAYNALTGATINSTFINNGSGIDTGMAFDQATNILYLIHNGVIGEYNASTGATISSSFISGLSNPFGLALSAGNLYVTNQDSGIVGEYNASSGSAIGGFSLSGLNMPRGVTAVGNILYVVSRGSGTIGTYNAVTGAAISPNFITGLGGPSGLTIDGTDLWVANTDASTVGEYNSVTGGVMNGSFINLISATGSITADFDVKYFGGKLYVGERFSSQPDAVGLFDATTGATINSHFVSFNADGPFGLAIADVPEIGTWASSVLIVALLAFQIIRAPLARRRQTARS